MTKISELEYKKNMQRLRGSNTSLDKKLLASLKPPRQTASELEEMKKQARDRLDDVYHEHKMGIPEKHYAIIERIFVSEVERAYTKGQSNLPKVEEETKQTKTDWEKYRIKGEWRVNGLVTDHYIIPVSDLSSLLSHQRQEILKQVEEEVLGFKEDGVIFFENMSEIDVRQQQRQKLSALRKEEKQ